MIEQNNLYKFEFSIYVYITLRIVVSANRRNSVGKVNIVKLRDVSLFTRESKLIDLVD